MDVGAPIGGGAAVSQTGRYDLIMNKLEVLNNEVVQLFQETGEAEGLARNTCVGLLGYSGEENTPNTSCLSPGDGMKQAEPTSTMDVFLYKIEAAIGAVASARGNMQRTLQIIHRIQNGK